MSYQAQGLVRDLDMRAPLKPILMAYATHADDLGYVCVSVETIAFDSGYGVTAVKAARKTLIEAGWMASKRRAGAVAIGWLNLDKIRAERVCRSDQPRVDTTSGVTR